MATFKKIACKKLGVNFSECTEIVTTPLVEPKESQILVKMSVVGINASDINFTNGLYFNTPAKPPFDCGFEGIGHVTAVGSLLTSKFHVGDVVYVIKFGCFAEYVYADEKTVFKIPSADPAFLALMTSGLTASISLDELGHLKSGQVVLVTAAAGGTGQFAVQLAKLSGCHVIGTCSSPEKVEFLKKLGCDRVINYKEENLDKVLKKEYPKGVDVVYELVGGKTFDVCVENLATFGRLIVIGAVSQYQDGSAWDTSKGNQQNASKVPIGSLLLKKSASISGFFLVHYTKKFPQHAKKLAGLYMKGQLSAGIDPKKWNGLEQVADAVNWLYQGKNIGKIVVNITKSSL